MANGSVIAYDGKRGKVFGIKYRDAEGKQVMESLGPERAGWTEKKARAELRERLVRVDKKGYRKPAALSFGTYARQWFRDGPSKRGWKPSTIRQYRSTERRLVDWLGAMPLAEIRPRHLAEFVAAHEQGPATIARDLALLHAIFQSAKREELVDSNPAEATERPKLPRQRWRILEPVEVAR